jgi:hypothetical protein
MSALPKRSAPSQVTVRIDAHFTITASMARRAVTLLTLITLVILAVLGVPIWI